MASGSLPIVRPTRKRRRQAELYFAPVTGGYGIDLGFRSIYTLDSRTEKKKARQMPPELLRLEWGVENRYFVPVGEIKDLIRTLLTEIHGLEDALLLSLRLNCDDSNVWKEKCKSFKEKCCEFVIDKSKIDEIIFAEARDNPDIGLLAGLLKRFRDEYREIWFRHVKTTFTAYIKKVSRAISYSNKFTDKTQWKDMVWKCIQTPDAPKSTEWIRYIEDCSFRQLDEDDVYNAMVEFGIVFDPTCLLSPLDNTSRAAERYQRTLQTVLLDLIPISALSALVASYVMGLSD